MSDLNAYLFVEWKQKSVVVLIRANKGIRIFPEVTSSRFVQYIISDDVTLIFEKIDDFQPHLNELVIHTIFICKEVMRKLDDIVANIILEERKFHAILFEREAICVFA